MANTAGYSGTPLAKKLGIAPGSVVCAVGAPANYRTLLEPVPDRVTFTSRVTTGTDLVHLFVRERAALGKALATYRTKIRPDAAVWISWPKKASGIPTSITEDTIRELCLPIGFVDVKVCAVDDTWSGLKLVIRKELRR